ncbi:nicotinamide N-methyltransferase-like, partial [Haematococcus lacustris]
DLIYNHVGSLLLPHVIHRLASPDTLVLYVHTKHRFDHLDLESVTGVCP